MGAKLWGYKIIDIIDKGYVYDLLPEDLENDIGNVDKWFGSFGLRCRIEQLLRHTRVRNKDDFIYLSKFLLNQVEQHSDPDASYYSLIDILRDMLGHSEELTSEVSRVAFQKIGKQDFLEGLTIGGPGDERDLDKESKEQILDAMYRNISMELRNGSCIKHMVTYARRKPEQNFIFQLPKELSKELIVLNIASALAEIKKTEESNERYIELIYEVYLSSKELSTERQKVNLEDLKIATSNNQYGKAIVTMLEFPASKEELIEISDIVMRNNSCWKSEFYSKQLKIKWINSMMEHSSEDGVEWHIDHAISKGLDPLYEKLKPIDLASAFTQAEKFGLEKTIKRLADYIDPKEVKERDNSFLSEKVLNYILEKK